MSITNHTRIRKNLQAHNPIKEDHTTREKRPTSPNSAEDSDRRQPQTTRKTHACMHARVVFSSSLLAWLSSPHFPPKQAIAKGILATELTRSNFDNFVFCLGRFVWCEDISSQRKHNDRRSQRQDGSPNRQLPGNSEQQPTQRLQPQTQLLSQHSNS